MGTEYQLVNQTKQQRISFTHLPVGKLSELTGNPVSAAMVTWYLLQNQGDMIQFVSDTCEEWPFMQGKYSDLDQYVDVTDSVLAKLIAEGFLEDNGKEWADEDEPDTVYIRAIKNIWMND